MNIHSISRLFGAALATLAIGVEAQTQSAADKQFGNTARISPFTLRENLTTGTSFDDPRAQGKMFDPTPYAPGGMYDPYYGMFMQETNPMLVFRGTASAETNNMSKTDPFHAQPRTDKNHLMPCRSDGGNNPAGMAGSLSGTNAPLQGGYRMGMSRGSSRQTGLGAGTTGMMPGQGMYGASGMGSRRLGGAGSYANHSSGTTGGGFQQNMYGAGGMGHSGSSQAGSRGSSSFGTNISQASGGYGKLLGLCR